MQLALTEEKLYKTCNRSLPMRFRFHKLSKNKHRASQKASVFKFPFANMEVEENIHSICSKRRMSLNEGNLNCCKANSWSFTAHSTGWQNKSLAEMNK